jgi:WhiB family redox-sensing transcriptional regulator
MLSERSTAETRDWQSQALCRGLNPDLFHPGRGEDVEAPKAICRQCPVQVECLEHALRYHERRGVWGGASERERQRIAKRRRQV